MDDVGLRTGRNGVKFFGPVAKFLDFGISNSQSKMTKPSVWPFWRWLLVKIGHKGVFWSSTGHVWAIFESL